MGGFARRMSYWNAFAKKYPGIPSLRVDGGSIFNSGVAEAPIVHRWMLEGTYKSNLDALNLSAWDLPVWQEIVDLASAGQIAKEYLNIPLVSANVKAKVPNFPPIQRYLIKEYSLDPAAGGKRIRVGITGLLSDPHERISRREFQIQDPTAAARQVVEEIRDKTDYRIVLTDMDLGKTISLAVLVPGVNLIVVAHNYESISEPQKVGDTLVVIPVNEGRMLSEVRLVYGAGSEEPEFHARFVSLDRTVPDDPVMGELVRQAQLQVDSFRSGKVPGGAR